MSAQDTPTSQQAQPEAGPLVSTSALPLAPSSSGRVSGKSWKHQKSAIVRTMLPDGVKSKSWDDRMQKAQKEKAIKKLQTELSEEKRADKERRRQITTERKKAAEERRRLEEDKAKMGARKAARLRRKEGRTKKIHH
ncbi:Cgr1 family-domain-containing protein [Fomitopsis betulina]|nr:Cgr1 family-domain-containing protein [Fomitopsis betulina]